MRPKGLLSDSDYYELAKSLEKEMELKTFLDACESEYLERNPMLYRNLLFGVLRLRTTYKNELNKLLIDHPNDDYLKNNNKPKAKIERLDRVKEYLEERRERIAEQRIKAIEQPIRDAIDKHLPDFPMLTDPGVRGFMAMFMMFDKMSEAGIAKKLARFEELLRQDEEELDRYVNSSWSGSIDDLLLYAKEKQRDFSRFFLAVSKELAKAAKGNTGKDNNKTPLNLENINQLERALYYVYRVKAGTCPELQNEGELTNGLMILGEKHGVSGNGLKNKYYEVNEDHKRLKRTYLPSIKRIIPILSDYPEAQEIAKNEIAIIEKMNT